MPEAIAAPFFAFQAVSKAFAGNPVLREVSFDVRPGETVCIVGRSGVGKSVTLRLLMGFLKPDAGRVIAAGHDITAWPEARLTELHKKVTLVFQSGALFDSLTVGENVAFPLREQDRLPEEDVREVVDRLLEMLEIGRFRDEHPAALSTGMKRAVAIARALAARPEAILYDEPTTMVDPMMVHVIADLMRKVREQVQLTSVVVTHDTRLARMIGDRLVFLHEGQARFFGTIADMDASTDEVLRTFLRQDEGSLLTPAGRASG
ncbi:MAG: ABC transporter ATP-binding protein [Terriglobales bacterium]